MPDPAPDTGPPAGSEGLLLPALKLAFDVARIDARSSPVIEPPRAVRPFLQFTNRLPDGALAALRRGLDEDEGFRARVAGLADEHELGRPGWLFIMRPDGWEAELAILLADADAKARADREEREERSARRRLAHAERATERAETAAARARAQLEAASTELAGERRSRRSAEEEAAQLTRRVASLEGERDSARRKAAEASAEADRLRDEVEALGASSSATQAALAVAEAELEAHALQARAERLRAEAVGRPAGEGEAVGRPAAEAGAPGRPGAVRVGGPDLAAVAKAVAAAAAAASSLGDALVAASAALAPPSVPTGPGPGGAPGAPHPPPRRPVARRRPAGLPPAVFDDTTEAAAHLVRVPGALVLVDGYNAAKALWPAQSPLELRERLIDALSELVARTGASVHVVYDGADLGLPASRPVSRRGVRVSFSPADVEADDVILDLADAEPVERTVVVASSDRRVQDGARRRGANVISTAQLAAVVGRS